jgi:hypothetical protein
LTALVLATALSGCGPKEPFDYTQVSGKVTWEDGTPITGPNVASVEVMFYPLAPPKDPKTHPKPGNAALEADGSFSKLTSHKPNDGVVPGKHKVAILTFDATHTQLHGIVPAEYESKETTPIEVDTANSPFDIKVKKPM